MLTPTPLLLLTPTLSDRTTDDDESEEDEWDMSEDDRGMSEAVGFLVGNRVKVWWPASKNWYEGVVTDVDQSDCTYEVHYSHDNEYQ